MFVIQYNYDAIQRLFGTFVADNISIIWPCVGTIMVILILRFISRCTEKKEKPEIRNGWAYNESARMWVNPEQLDEEKNRRAYEENRRRWEAFQRSEAELEKRREERRKNPPNKNERTWYPTGWTLDKDTGLWEAPDYVSLESDERWKWDPEKRIWIDKEKEARLKRYQERRAKEGQPPSFEEWKAARQKEQGSDGST